jgi:flagellar assembly protein FliH
MSQPAPAPAFASRRFTFDTVFDGEQTIAPVRAKRSFTLEEVEAIRAETFAAGERSAVAEAERAAAAALGEVVALVRHGLSALTGVAHEHRAGSAELAMCAARKIADAALDAFPHAPVEAAVVALAREVDAVPRLVVRCAAADPARLEANLARAAEAAGYPGQVAMKIEPAMPPAAFVLDWGDGRAAFDPDAAAMRIQAALTAALAAEGLHAEPIPLPTGDHP